MNTNEEEECNAMIDDFAFIALLTKCKFFGSSIYSSFVSSSAVIVAFVCPSTYLPAIPPDANAPAIMPRALLA